MACGTKGCGAKKTTQKTVKKTIKKAPSKKK